jgi:uncharacterized protein (TIGR02145 family)
MKTAVFILIFLCLNFNSKSQVVPQGFLVVPVTNESVTIGSQFWLKRNLNVISYNNGDPIPYYSNNIGWGSLTTPAMCSYNFDASNDAVYGKLYNYYAVIDARGICPIGWHTPTDGEFSTLNTTIGGNGGTLKETGLLHWDSPNSGATNSTNFTALGAGYMGTSAPSLQRNVTYFWTASSYDATRAYTWSLSKDNTSFTQSNANTKVGGFSVRCIKN